MNIGTAVVSVIVLCALIAAVKKTIKDRKKGGCGCGCEGCNKCK